MTPTSLAVLGAHAATVSLDRNLVLGGALLSPAVIARAQVNTRATAADAAGTWSEFLADTARFHGAAARLLAEGQRSNGIRNPRGEGAGAGVNATNWSNTASAAGVTMTILGAASHAGMTGVEAEFTGTASAAASLSMVFETATGVAAASGQVWTTGVFWRLVSGTAPNGACQARIVERDNAGAVLTSHNTAVAAPAAGLARAVGTSGTFGASAGRVSNAAIVTWTSGTAVNARIQYFWPQLEQGAFASTPILPPAGSPAASTRGADLTTASLAALGIAGPCTVLWSGMVPQAASNGLDHTLVTLSTGSDSNRIRLRNVGGGNTIVGGRVTGGASADAAVAGTMAPGTPFRAGIALNGAGRAAFSLNGSAAVAVTGGPTGLTTLHLGNNVGGTAPMFGETLLLRTRAEALSDAALAAAVAALPS